ncbi:MAG: MMPL family transporter [Chloroflexota bacterium]|nr:MMPL family transporter [Chloroflexota bacterium]MDE2884676.1 MMPL family transporter [Chloroflexota bacterium]
MTEALARISSRRPWVTIGAWLVAVLLALGIVGQLLPTATTTELRIIPRFGEVGSVTAGDLLEGTAIEPPPAEVVIVHSETLTVDDAAFKAKVEEVTAKLRELEPEVIRASTDYYEVLAASPLDSLALVSTDRRSAIVAVQMTGTLGEALENIEEVIHVVEEADGKDGFDVLIVGDVSSRFEQAELSAMDLEQGERFGIPVALLILLVLFGAVVAALIPIGLAVISILVTLAIVAVIGTVFGELVFFVLLWITMIGLAVGIDYSLIVVSRFREELARGLSKRDAVIKAGATASRTVFFSGMTVVIALLGVFIVPHTLFFATGLGAILVVIVSVTATLTFLPAVLTVLGPRVDRLRLPFRRSASSASSGGQREGFWEFITRKTMRYPVISIIVVGGLMVWASVSYFGINTGFNSVETFPHDSHTREAFTALEEDFPLGYGSANPARVVIEGDISDPAVAAAVQAFKQAVVGDPLVAEVLQKIRQAVESDPALVAALLQSNPEILSDPSAAALAALLTNTHGSLTVIAIPVPGAPSSADAFDLIKRLREDYIPAAFSGVEAEAHVGGISAEYLDFDTQLRAYLPIIFAFILGVSFILLLVVFRSIVIPIKAIIMNLLSVGAAYGLMVLVFQRGVGADLFGFQQVETIEAWLPLILFAILFGLSMDYHVFMLSRIRERYDQTHDNAESVAYGLRSTASLITGAALIMVAVFSGFASGDMVVNQQAGFGLAVAVLLDATLVRSILVPASMQLLGARNWYLPGFLNWLPQIQVEAEEGERAS